MLSNMTGTGGDVDTLMVIADKVSFMSKVVMLNRATSDDEVPTPGYMLKEIRDITYENGSYCQALLDFLVDRLNKKSYHIKLKSLRIMKMLVEHGHHEFRQGLRKNAQGIRAATNFSGPPDPLHGNAPYIMIRKTSQELSEILFDTEYEFEEAKKPAESFMKSTGGMGSSQLHNRYQGFGNTQEKPKSLGESLISGLKDFAERVADPQNSRNNSVQKVMERSASSEYQPPPQLSSPYSEDISLSWQQSASQHSILDASVSMETSGSSSYHSFRDKTPPTKGHVKGVAGGGWEDDPVTLDEPATSTASASRSADGSVSSDSKLNSSEDFSTEFHFIQNFLSGKESIPSRLELKTFIKRYSSLNCDACVQLLNGQLKNQNTRVIMRALMALEQLLRTDMASIDHMAVTCHHSLKQLYRYPQGSAVQSKARKIIRQLEKLTKHRDLFSDIPPTLTSNLQESYLQYEISKNQDISHGVQNDQRDDIHQQLDNEGEGILGDGLNSSHFTFLRVPFAGSPKSATDHEVHTDSFDFDSDSIENDQREEIDEVLRSPDKQSSLNNQTTSLSRSSEDYDKAKDKSVFSFINS